MCLSQGDVGGDQGESIGFGLYQSCVNKGGVYVFGLRWLGVVGRVGWYYVLCRYQYRYFFNCTAEII